MDGWRNKIRKNSFLRWSLLFSNWLFQGIWNSDITEKVYKLLFSFVFTGFFFLFFHLDSKGLDFLFAFLVAHTLNWLVNGSISAILIHRLFLWEIDKEKVFNYLQGLKERTDRSSVICYCAVFGSIARGELKGSSDIDVGFLRKPGFVNAIKGLFFITRERILTNIQGIPFEGYLVDSLDIMVTRFKKEEVPVVIKQTYINGSFPVGISLDEAKKLNNVH